jgi:hypothetical protein
MVVKHEKLMITTDIFEMSVEQFSSSEIFGLRTI